MVGKSNRLFANEHDIDEKTARQIKDIDKKKYAITIETLEKICTAKDISLKEFFNLIGR